MKKKIIIIISLLLIGAILFWIINAFSKVESEKREWPLTMSVENVSSTGVTVVFTDNGGSYVDNFETGSYYFIETLVDGKWVAVDYKDELKDDNIGWNAIAYIIKKNDVTEFNVTWEWLYGRLVSGQYRIGKEITYKKQKETYYAEFIID